MTYGTPYRSDSQTATMTGTTTAVPSPSFPSASSSSPTLHVEPLELPPAVVALGSDALKALEVTRSKDHSTGQTAAGAVTIRAGERAEDLKSAQCSKWGLSLTFWKYLQIFSGFLMNSLSWGIITSFGTFLDLYDGILGDSFSDGLLSMVGGTQVLLLLSWSAINGRLVDAGYHRWIALCGMVVLPLSFGLLSHLAPMAKFWVIWLIGGFGIGWGTACFGLVGPLNVAQWFPGNNGIPVGIVSSGGSLGGVIFPLVLKKLVDLNGFSVGMERFAEIVAVLAILAVVMARINPDYKARPIDKWQTWDTWFDKCCFQNRSFNLYVLAIVATWFGYPSILYHIPQWVRERQGLTRDANEYLSYMNLGGFIGRIIGGIVASHLLTPTWTQACAAAVSIISIVGFWNFAHDIATTAIFCVLYGIIGGCLLGCQITSITYILTTSRSNCAGSWMGMLWILCAPFAVTGPTIGGELRGKYGLRSVGYFSTVCFTLAFLALVATAMNERRCKGDQGKAVASQYRAGANEDENDLGLEKSRSCNACDLQGHV